MSLYSNTKFLEAGVQVLRKPNTKINNNSKTVGVEPLFIWIVAKFCFKYLVNLTVIVIYYHPHENVEKQRVSLIFKRN